MLLKVSNPRTHHFGEGDPAVTILPLRAFLHSERIFPSPGPVGVDEFCTSLGFAADYRTRLRTLLIYLLQGQPGRGGRLKPDACGRNLTLKHLRRLLQPSVLVYMGIEANQFRFRFHCGWFNAIRSDWMKAGTCLDCLLI